MLFYLLIYKIGKGSKMNQIPKKIFISILIIISVISIFTCQIDTVSNDNDTVLPEPEIWIGFDGLDVKIVREIPTGTIENFGEVCDVRAPSNKTFTIKNNGDDDLILSGDPVVLINGGSSNFEILSQPVSTITPGNSTTFEVSFKWSRTEGAYSDTITIENNDSDEDPYTIAIDGTVSSLCSIL